MGGEHYDSKEGKGQRKSKDPYLVILYPNEPDPIKTIVTKAQLKADPEMLAFVEKHGLAQNPKPENCPIDDKACVQLSKGSLSFQLMNWNKPATEKQFDVHEACVQADLRQRILALKMLGKNPTFTPTIVCQAALACRFFQAPSVPGAFNCRHIAVGWNETKQTPVKGKHLVTLQFEPQMYCKRGHPGRVTVTTEAWTHKGVGSMVNMLVQAKVMLAGQRFARQFNRLGKTPPILSKLKSYAEKNPESAKALLVACRQVDKMLTPVLEEAA